MTGSATEDRNQLRQVHLTLPVWVIQRLDAMRDGVARDRSSVVTRLVEQRDEQEAAEYVEIPA